jgi:hypothetical protein
MENLYSWLIIFCGATIAFLGSFLFVSERELRNKRREFDEFKRKQTTKPVDKSTEEAPSKSRSAISLTDSKRAKPSSANRTGKFKKSSI